MIALRRYLPRRSVLRGAGAVVALPLLEAMVPALTPTVRTAAAARFRLGCVYLPQGIVMEQWTPASAGAGFELTPLLRPLEAFRQQLVVVSGLAQQDVGTAHLTASAMWLNGVVPRKTEGLDVGSGITLDQYVAAEIGGDTPFRSLEIGTEDMSGSIGACDAGYSCVYLNSLSWRTPTTPLPMELNPRVLFERMFGDPVGRGVRPAPDGAGPSLLDSIADAARALQGRVGRGDAQLVADYLDGIREVERRIQAASRHAATDVALPAAPTGVPASYEAHVTLMYDLMALAYQADLTRVVTFMLAREGSQVSYPQVGVTEGHHSASHHKNDPGRIASVARIHLFHMGLFGRFLGKLRNMPDGDGSMLDHVLLLFGSGMSDGNLHRRDNLPLLVAGGGGGTVVGGRHLTHPPLTPHADLLLSIAAKAGVPLDHIGDSNARVEL